VNRKAQRKNQGRARPQPAVEGKWAARWTAIKAAPRVVVLFLFILGIFYVFGRRLWYMQFVEGELYSAAAEQQSTREITVPAARGIIYDRNGTQLVRNVPSFRVTVIPAYLPTGEGRGIVIASREAENVLIRLAFLLNMPYTTAGGGMGAANPAPGVRDILRNVVKDRDGNEVPFSMYYRAVTIKRNVDRETAMLVAQQSLVLPGVSVEVEPVREYLYSPLMSQIMGYLLPIPEEVAEVRRAKGYDPATDRIGYAGVEAVYEDYLKGAKGHQIIEEDVLGRLVRVVAEVDAPVPGDNVYLTIDLELQAFVEQALQEGMDAPRVNSPRGVAIVMNPQTSEILAMVSLPTYDNNIFTRGASTLELQHLYGDTHRPMINHAIMDRLHPGSVFKVVIASAALQEEIVYPQHTHVSCPGKIVVPNRYAPNDPGLATSFFCWNRSGHGALDVVGGIAHSCNVFFYTIGGGNEEERFEGLGVNRIVQYTELFGFGKPTGVDLPGEVGGLVPNPRWKREQLSESWNTGNTYHFSIGEGFLEVTPLQMLNAINAIANGGQLYRPRVVQRITDAEGVTVDPRAPELIRTLPISQAHLATVRLGMEGAVAYGTAPRAQLEGINVAGKTGTAQYCDDIARLAGKCDGGWPEHAWFAAFAPVEEPEVSVIVFLYDGGEGSTAAVPVAHDILAHYFGLDEDADEAELAATHNAETTP